MTTVTKDGFKVAGLISPFLSQLQREKPGKVKILVCPHTWGTYADAPLHVRVSHISHEGWGRSQNNQIPDVLSEDLGEVNAVVNGNLKLERRGCATCRDFKSTLLLTKTRVDSSTLTPIRTGESGSAVWRATSNLIHL